MTGQGMSPGPDALPTACAIFVFDALTLRAEKLSFPLAQEQARLELNTNEFLLIELASSVERIDERVKIGLSLHERMQLAFALVAAIIMPLAATRRHGLEILRCRQSHCRTLDE